MLELSDGWHAEIEHAREWLCLRLREPFSSSPVCQLAEQIRRILDREYARHLVLEMDHVLQLTGRLLRQIQLLDQHLNCQGGELRLSGLSDECYAALQQVNLQARFPRYRSRQQALNGHYPEKPR